MDIPPYPGPIPNTSPVPNGPVLTFDVPLKKNPPTAKVAPGEIEVTVILKTFWPFAGFNEKALLSVFVHELPPLHQYHPLPGLVVTARVAPPEPKLVERLPGWLILMLLPLPR